MSNFVKNKSPVVVGIDLGGTGTRFVVSDGASIISRSVNRSAEIGGDVPLTSVDSLATLIEALIPSNCELVGVGIGASGPLDLDNGVVLNPHTLPWFSDFPLVSLLSNRLAVPVRLENDAATCALGEYRYGAGQGSSRLLVITLGTGVGGSLVIDGNLWNDHSGNHLELGHIPLGFLVEDCYCGLTGCWEMAIAREKLERRLEDLPRSVRLTDVVEILSREDDQDVRGVLSNYGRDVGRGLEAYCVAFGPDRIVMSGGVSRYLSLFLEGITSQFARTRGFEQKVTVVQGALEEFGGAIGATVLAGL